MKSPSNKVLLQLGISKSYHISSDRYYYEETLSSKSESYDQLARREAIENGRHYREHMSFDLASVANTKQRFKFYGAHSNMFKLDSMTLEAIEDPDDGYRSYLACVVVTKDEEPGGFFESLIATVKVIKSKKIDGWEIVDAKAGHVWLEIGTDRIDGYYPCFCFNYSPRKST